MMTECIICKKIKEEAELYQGIYENEIVKVCGKCAKLEEVPLIKKPTQEQLQQADRKYSVRERMEKITGMEKKMPLSKEQLAAGKNLKNLEFPKKRQENEKLVKNYYWAIKMARRRIKLSVNQLAKRIGISPEILDAIEHGQLPENFEQIMLQLELSLGINILKNKSKIINFAFPAKSQQQEIVEKVREKMEKEETGEEEKSNPHSDLPNGKIALRKSSGKRNLVVQHDKSHAKEKKEDKKKIIKDIASGRFDFSKRKNIGTLTLNDLIDMKKQKQKKEMFGDDLDLEEEV